MTLHNMIPGVEFDDMVRVSLIDHHDDGMSPDRRMRLENEIKKGEQMINFGVTTRSLMDSELDSVLVRMTMTADEAKPYRDIYNCLAGDLGRLEAYEACICCDRANRELRIQLSLRNGLFVTVSEEIDNSDGVADFAISTTDELLVKDKEPFGGLVNQILEVRGPYDERDCVRNTSVGNDKNSFGTLFERPSYW